jgi:outer membrane protein TolC
MAMPVARTPTRFTIAWCISPLILLGGLTSEIVAQQSPPGAVTTHSSSPLPAPYDGPAVLRSDVQVLLIDLPTALRLANAGNPTIGVARARVQEAYARLRQAEVAWVPDLQAGPSYLRHDGLLQTSSGLVISVNKWNLFAGGGAHLALETSEALFAPLIARRLVEAEAAASRAVSDDVQLEVALAYIDLVRTYGALAISSETLSHAEEMLRLADAAERNGFGKTPADNNRARTEVQSRCQEHIRLEGQIGVVSARLAQLLLLEPTVQLRPAEPGIVPIALVPPDVPLSDLVATGLMNRPELAESRSLVAATLARWRQARAAPLLPRLEVSYIAGEFGGGLDDNTQRFGGRGDGAAQALWTLHNFGAGDIARARAGRAQYDQANLHALEVQARVAAEVAAAANLVLSRQKTLDHAQKAVQQGEEMWRRLLKWTTEVGFRVKQYEALELLTAEQALNQARTEYLTEVIEYNQQQFRLYWAMGQPALEALPKATALPVSVPVQPSSQK